MKRLLGEKCPAMGEVKGAFVEAFGAQLSAALSPNCGTQK
jgi:hypothetical protein